MQPWECPKCGRVYAGWVWQCDYCNAAVKASENLQTETPVSKAFLREVFGASEERESTDWAGKESK